MIANGNCNMANSNKGNGVGIRVSQSHDEHMSDNNDEKKDDRILYESACHMVTHVYNTATGEDRCAMVGSDTKKLDYHEAEVARSSLLFGEVTQAGVDKILDDDHLYANNAGIIYDLGSGNGKLAMQAFLQYPNVRKVVGVEIAVSRSIRSFAAASRLSLFYPSRFTCDNYETIDDSGKARVITSAPDNQSTGDLIKIRRAIVTDGSRHGSGNGNGGSGRTLELRRQSLFDCEDALLADIVICETEICNTMWLPLTQFLAKMKTGSRLLTYENIEHMYTQCKQVFPFVRICAGDRYFTSWAPTNGHAFHLWRHI